MRGYVKIDEMKQDYETIPVPEDLKQRVQKGITQAKEEEKVKRIPVWGLRIAGCAVAAMLVLTLLTNLNAPIAHAMSDIPVLGSIVKIVTFRTYESNDKDMSAKVKIPEVEIKDSEGKKNDAATEEINNAVDEYTQEIIEQYKADVKATNGEGKEEVSVDYKIVTNNANLFSLKIDTTVALNTSGITIKIYHIDKKTGKLIQLKDVFKDDADYLSVLTKEVKRQMRKQMLEDDQKMYFIDDEDMPELNWTGLTDEANFYINSNGELTIAFDKYEVAPGYMGACEFTIPQKLIKDMVKTEYFQ